MVILRCDGNKHLSIVKNDESSYRNENEAVRLTFMIAQTVSGYDITECDVHLNILNAKEQLDSILLSNFVLDETGTYYTTTYDLLAKHTQVIGDLKIWFEITHSSNSAVVKTNVVVKTNDNHYEATEVIPSATLSLFDGYITQMSGMKQDTTALKNAAQGYATSAQSSATSAASSATTAQQKLTAIEADIASATTFINTKEQAINEKAEYVADLTVKMPKLENLHWYVYNTETNQYEEKNKAVPSITVGTVSQGEEGTQPIITNSGDEIDAVFNFTIPRGNTGDKGDQGYRGSSMVGISNTSYLIQYASELDEGNAYFSMVWTGQDTNFVPSGSKSVYFMQAGDVWRVNINASKGISSMQKLGTVKGAKGDTGERGEKGNTGNAGKDGRDAAQLIEGNISVLESYISEFEPKSTTWYWHFIDHDGSHDAGTTYHGTVLEEYAIYFVSFLNTGVLEDIGWQGNIKGAKGDTGAGITDITTEQKDGYTLATITYGDGETATVNLPNGEDGADGVDGANGQDGADAKINGVNTLSIVEGDNISLSQSGSTLTISADSVIEEVDYNYFEPIQVSGVNWEENEIGYSLNATTGRPSPTGNNKRAISPLIEVKEGETYIRATGFATFTYDANGNKIEYHREDSFNELIYKFTIASGVKYVRLDYHTSNSPAYYREYDGLWLVSPSSNESANKVTNDVMYQERISPFKDKTIVCFGDSITGNSRFPIAYPDVISKTLRCKKVYNVGFGGARMSATSDSFYNAFTMKSLSDSIAASDFTTQTTAWANRGSKGKLQYQYSLAALQEINTAGWSNVDYITIAYGTNDFGTPLSSIIDALSYSVQTILTAYPNIKPIVLTPIYRVWTDGNADTKVSVSGYTLRDIANAIKDKCYEMHIPCIDLMNSLGINQWNYSNYLMNESGEYTHPNTAGLNLMGETISGGILSMATIGASKSIKWGDIAGDINDQADLATVATGLSDAIISLETDVANKQDTLTTAQLNAANSGITSSKVSTYDGYAANKMSADADGGDILVGDSEQFEEDVTILEAVDMLASDIDSKQDSLTRVQLNAVNSGITSLHILQYNTYATSKANVSDVYTKSEIDTKIGDIESLLAEV